MIDVGMDKQTRIHAQEAAPYTLLSSLGRGQLTEVYSAVSATGSPVVVTFFHQQEGLDSKRFVLRFHAEAQRLITLRHPHILSVLDYGEYAGSCFLVTEAGKGATLASFLRQHKQYDFQDAARLIEQVSTALDTAHSQSILHRGLSPKYVLVEREQRIQIAGFGLYTCLLGAGIHSSVDPLAQIVSIAGTYLGNPAYIAPECLSGEGGSPRSDLYALAILLFELLAGHPPFEGNHFLTVCLAPLSRPFPNLSAFRPDAPAMLDQFFQKAANWRPEERFANASDLLEAYRSIIDRNSASQSLFLSLEPDKENSSRLAMQEEAPSEARHVLLSDLSPAPWIQEEPIVRPAISTQLHRVTAEQETYYRAVPPTFEEIRLPQNAGSRQTEVGGQHKRIRLTVSIEATIDALRSLFGSSSAPAWQDLTRAHCFPARSEDFPVEPFAFATRAETFSSARSPIVLESEPIVETYSPRRYQLPAPRT